MQNDTSSRLNGRGKLFLDQIHERISRNQEEISPIMFDLLQGLHEIRRDIPRDEWRRFCKETVPSHHLVKMIHQDPFTLHSVRKPRGYPGDAALLDFIYGRRTAPTTTLGERIFEFTTNTPPSRGVRCRARIIAGIIDRLARQRGSLRILSIACGHLREAEISEAVREGKVTEYVAFDQDEESLAHVRERFPNERVTTIRGSLGELLLGRHKGLGQFDFVYAAGLYDYLSEKLATRLTTWMFNVTAPGGVTLLTNYLPDIVGAGYMEAFMEWELIFRSPEELADTARRIPADQIADYRSYVEENNMIAFVELLKASSTPPVLPPPVFHPVAPRRNGVQATTR